MKTMKFILACVLLLSPLLCQAQKNLFNKYNDMKGVSSVYISKAMMELNPNLFMKDLYIGKVAEHLNSVQVLSTHDNKVREEMAKDIRSLVQSSKYELLMKQKSTVSGSEVYVNRKGSKVKELIMVMNGASSLKFVYMEGDMTTDDIKKLMLYQSTSQNFIISGDLFYANNKPVTYFKKENSDNQKDMAELSGTYNLNSIDMNYKDTLLMPKTEFEMRGNLPKKEPKYVERWQESRMYEKVIQQNESLFHQNDSAVLVFLPDTPVQTEKILPDFSEDSVFHEPGSFCPASVQSQSTHRQVPVHPFPARYFPGQ